MIGIRGSMPGDGHKHDVMLMRFVVQYLQEPGGHWVDLPGSAESGFIRAGSGSSARQAGQSVQLAPVQGGVSFELRGLVEFQWRDGRSVRLSALRTTTAGHHSLAGARPKGFSAATCEIG